MTVLNVAICVSAVVLCGISSFLGFSSGNIRIGVISAITAIMNIGILAVMAVK